MVNSQFPSTKNNLLRILRAKAGVRLSGEFLAAEAGVSRVAVWKALRALKDCGYAIETDTDGYLLINKDDDDFLHPWEFGGHEANVRWWKETGSTMDRARELAAKGERGPMVLVAESQSAGRDRKGGFWASPPGGLFFTLLLPGGAPLSRSGRDGLKAQIAVADVAAELLAGAAKPELRWPNALVLGGRRLAGVLTEIAASGDRLDYGLVGVGLHVADRGDPGCVSLAELLPAAPKRRRALELFLDRFSSLAGLDDEGIAREWTKRPCGLGRPVSASMARDGRDKSTLRTEGRFAGVDAYGRALVEDGKTIYTVDPGEGSLEYAP